MYENDDSDDDSDFEVKYEQDEDNYEDLKSLGVRPLFIGDLILAFSSEDVQRFTLAIENSENLIRSQKSNDLEVMCHDFLIVLFRTSDKFAIENFLQLKYQKIQATIEMVPKIALPEVIARILDSEASLGEKIFLFDVIARAAIGLSDISQDEVENDFEEAKDKQNKLAMSDAEFFEMNINHPIVSAGRITKRLKAPVIIKGKKNSLLPIAHLFFYPCLYLLEDYQNVSKHR